MESASITLSDRGELEGSIDLLHFSKEMEIFITIVLSV